MVTFLPARLGPWAEAGVSARMLDVRTSDPAVVIRLVFLLDIDFYLRGVVGPIRNILHTIITSYGNQGGAALRHVSQPSKAATSARHVNQTLSQTFSQRWATNVCCLFFILRRIALAGTSLCSVCTVFGASTKSPNQHCLFGASRRSTCKFVPSRSSCL